MMMLVPWNGEGSRISVKTGVACALMAAASVRAAITIDFMALIIGEVAG